MQAMLFFQKANFSPLKYNFVACDVGSDLSEEKSHPFVLVSPFTESSLFCVVSHILMDNKLYKEKYRKSRYRHCSFVNCPR